MSKIRLWIYRIRVSVYGSWFFKRWGLYGFQSERGDRNAFNSGMTVKDYFMESWCDYD